MCLFINYVGVVTYVFSGALVTELVIMLMVRSLVRMILFI
jgi:hypothetical protein